MFDNHELIRIYYAVLKDTEIRKASEFAFQFQGEIDRNVQIMAKIESTGLILKSSLG